MSGNTWESMIFHLALLSFILRPHRQKPQWQASKELLGSVILLVAAQIVKRIFW